MNDAEAICNCSGVGKGWGIARLEVHSQKLSAIVHKSVACVKSQKSLDAHENGG